MGDVVNEQTMRDWLGMLINNKERITDQLVKRRVEYGNLPGAVEAQKSYRNHSNRIKTDPNLHQYFDISQRLPKVTFPLGLVWGKNDRFAPVELAENIKKALPNLTEFHLVEGSGHQLLANFLRWATRFKTISLTGSTKSLSTFISMHSGTPGMIGAINF